jgi:hypothetical protein
MILNKNDEEWRFQEKGKAFERICWDCEKLKSLNITESEVIVIEDDKEDVEIIRVDDEEDLEIIRMEIDDEDSDEYGNEQGIKRSSNAYQLLLEELDSLRGITEGSDRESSNEEIERNNLMEKVNYYFRKLLRNDKKILEVNYELGKWFTDELTSRIGRSRKGRRMRNEIYKEIAGKREYIKAGQIKEIGRRIRRAETVYNLFRKIGKYKMKKLKLCGYTTIIACRKGEIEKLIELYAEE